MVEKVMNGEAEDGGKPEDDIEIVEVDTKGQPIQQASDEDDEDERLSGDEQDDARGEPGAQPAPRKRETHQERRERHRKARERDQKEMNFLRNEVSRLGQQVERVNQGTIQNAVQSIDARLSEALAQADQAERIEAAAIKANNGEDAVKARRIREEAIAQARTLQTQRQTIQAPPQVPSYLPQAQEFAKDKPWFTWDQNDQDSRQVLEIDNSVARDGYNPNTPAYWQELNRRVKERLPHKFGSAESDRQDDDLDEDVQTTRRKKGPPVGAGRTHAPETTRREVYISPERKQAMIDAGVWDDPVLRKKYVKSYQSWDRSNSARR